MVSILFIFFRAMINMEKSLKNSKVKLDLLTNIDMLLMVEKSIRVGIYHVIHRHVKAINKYMKDYNKNKVSLVFSIGM